MKNRQNYFSICLFLFLILSANLVFSANKDYVIPSSKEAFDHPNLLSYKELYKYSREALSQGKLNDARLFALRAFLDGKRSKNLLNLLGVIELQARNNLLASEWFRKSLCISLNNKIARKYLSRLPSKPVPIPIDPTELAEHFTDITNKLPAIVSRLSNKKIHSSAIMEALERGQIYMALALSEEYEKRYTDANGPAMTALCAWYLGRNKDALQIVNQTLKKHPYNPILLFIKAVINDGKPGTSSVSYFRALYDLDKWKRALKLTKKFNKIFKKSPDAYIVKARIMLDLHEIKEAGKAIQQAALRDPGNPEIDLLWVEYFLQRGMPERASRRLNRAFKRGYNLPSVPLTAGMFAVQGNRINEINVILNDAEGNRPFTDPESYPLYISLLLMMDDTKKAREALNEWERRFPKRSMVCYLEAVYNLRIGDNAQGLKWLKRGFKLNPNRLGIIQFLSGFPAVLEDRTLSAQIGNRLAKAGVKGYSKKLVPKPVEAKQPHNIAQINNQAQSSGAGIFQITLGNTISPAARGMMTADLQKLYAQVSPYIGKVKVPIFINLVSADGMGDTIAMYEPANTAITVTSTYFDSEALRTIINSGLEGLSEQEIGGLVNDFPTHVLARELVQLMIQIIIPNAKTNPEPSEWLQIGLAEILAGSPKVLRYKLLVANKSIEKKFAKLASAKMLNSIFAEGYSSPAVLDTASAQAYLMTSFLIKKSGGLKKGCGSVINLIRELSDGKDFATSLKNIFGLSNDEFTKGWRKAAFWALQQAVPYKWK